MATEQRDRLLEYLRRLHLRHAAQNLDQHFEQAAALKLRPEAFLLRVVEAEVLARKETAIKKRLGEADFPEILRLEDYNFAKQPTLSRERIMTLGELGFLDRCQCVLFVGPSSVGKTHLAISLGVRACQANYRVRFMRAFALFGRLYASLADDSFEDVLDELCKPDLLIIDELGNSPRKREHDYTGVFFELVARRYRHGSIIIATNLGFDQWHQALGAASQVTPSLDRLLDGAHIIAFPKDAPSYRAQRKEGPGRLPPPRRRRRSTKRGNSSASSRSKRSRA
jgi:DNA replication protein DnaC